MALLEQVHALAFNMFSDAANSVVGMDLGFGYVGYKQVVKCGERVPAIQIKRKPLMANSPMG